ncbi:hypothetical protein V6N13_105370 [Hibiscus sabdariffa]|uniref:anthranilate synthase n=1 Tax=Hibiscus sabdariffa TaxID=183260 RepID=A0ABR2EXR7_9ROSI
MAVNFITQSSLVQPKASLSAKTLQTPSLSQLSRLSPPSRVGFLLSKRSGIVQKASLASASSVLETEKSSKNPIIVIDNYDSFTYNLCQYLGEMGCHLEVYRNDEITVEELKRKNPRGVLISPGPDSGISLQTVLILGPTVPLFGVCLGLQCIGEAFGGKIVRSPSGAVHGKSSLVYYDEKAEDGLFTGLSNPFSAGRYHCFVIEKDSFPGEALEITAWTEDGLIMAVRHKVYKYLQGVQFHPESIITPEGKTIIRNFIKLIEKKEAAESKN